MGPTAWMTWRAARRPAPVMRAWPVGQPPAPRHSDSSAGPAARCIAPSTPPPPSRLLFAALTIASAVTRVMSPWSSRKVVRPAVVAYMKQLLGASREYEKSCRGELAAPGPRCAPHQEDLAEPAAR